MYCKTTHTFYDIAYLIKLRIHWRLSAILKASKKSLWNNFFWYAKVYISEKFTQHAIHWDEIEILKKFPSDKLNCTKNALSSRAPAHLSFTFNSQFLYKLKHIVHLGKTVRGNFHFWFRPVFINVYVFVQQKAR